MSRILVVEDNATQREALVDFLKLSGHDTSWVADGSAALDALGLGGIDAVVIDLYLPYLDGVEVIRRMRQRHDAHHVPVVLATAAEPDEVDQVRSKAALLGTVVVLQKPYDPAELLRVLATLTEKGAAGSPPS